MTTRLSMLNVLGWAAIAVGCSDGPVTVASRPHDASSAPDATDGSKPNDAMPDAGDGSDGCPDLSNLATTDGTCNVLPYPARRVPQTLGTGAQPTYAGGTLVDGLYEAVKVTNWATLDTMPLGLQMSLVVSNGGTKMFWAAQTLNADGTGEPDAGGLHWLRANYTVSASATSANRLTLGTDCLAGTWSVSGTLSYTATTTNPPQLTLGNLYFQWLFERQDCPTGP